MQNIPKPAEPASANHVCRGGSDKYSAPRRNDIPNAPLSPPERWVPHRKAEVVAAVRSGLLSLDEARQRYALSLEEFLAWQQGVTQFGLDGLRMGKIRQRDST
jgi:hypothetical protein